MKNVVRKMTNNPVYFGILFLAFSLVACSDDDDDGIVEREPTGSFDVSEEYDLTGNTLVLESITVGQDSWLVAVNPGDEATNNFISDLVMLETGENRNVQLTLDESAIVDNGTGQEIVLKLYADNPIMGTPGEWDPSDEPIMAGNNILLTETVTIFAEDTGGGTAFADFDANNDGMLDSTEVPNIYQNNFDEWDTDDDNMLSQDEFNTTAFSLTDMNDDAGIDADEWNDGFASFFGNWTDDDFAGFDADSSGGLDNDEWNDAFADSEWFGTFDADDDDLLDEDEWNTGLFNDWDLDGSNSIDEDEFNTFSAFAMNW